MGRFDAFQTVLGISNREVGACWCVSYRDARLNSGQRADYMEKECSREPGPGVLLYVDDEPAGWCSIAPREELPAAAAFAHHPHPRRPGCVDRGVLRDPRRLPQARAHAALLDAAVAHAKAHGADVVEGYPVDTGSQPVDVISGYVGTVPLFEAAGFELAAPTTAHSGGRDRVIMRRYSKPR